MNQLCSTAVITGLFVIALFAHNSRSMSPCANSGVFIGVDEESNVICLCQAGFYGSRCLNVLKSFSCMDPSDCGSTGVDCDSGICKCTAGGGVFPKECNETMGAEECTEDSHCLNGGNCTTFNSRCVCQSGFTGAGRCADVNECIDHQEAVCTDPDLPVCINTDGSFICAPQCLTCEEKIITAACRAAVSFTDMKVPNGCTQFLP